MPLKKALNGSEEGGLGLWGGIYGEEADKNLVSSSKVFINPVAACSSPFLLFSKLVNSSQIIMQIFNE